MGLLSDFILLTFLSFGTTNAAIGEAKHADSELQIPGRCDFINYCNRLRFYKINPTAHHPGVCPDPNICTKEVQSFVRRKDRVDFNAIPDFGKGGKDVCKDGTENCDRVGLYPTQTTQPDDAYPGTCKDLAHCDRTPQRESRPPMTVTPNEAHPGTCKDLAHCGRVPQRESRPVQPSATDTTNDALPGTCKDLAHCGRPHQRESRPHTTSKPTDAHPGAGRFPQRGGKPVHEPSVNMV